MQSVPGLVWPNVLQGVLILILAMPGCALSDQTLDTDPAACERAGERVQGTCEHDNSPCGCRSYVEDGRVVGGRCVD